MENSLYAGKRLGIMQPYFFPYLGYYSLIAATDRWIVFDPVQYIRKGWMNRNRVLKQGGGLKYVGITMAPHARETRIHEMRLSEDNDHLEHLVRHLDFYKHVRAPHYKEVVGLLELCFADKDRRLVHFLTRSLEHTCAYIGIPFRYEIYSEMGLEHEAAHGPGDWALNIAKTLKAESYINPPGGREFFVPDAFRAAGVELLYLEQQLPSYDQRTTNFEPGLSILDVMMFNDPAAIRQMLAQHTLEKA
jgi:hypothetical protein